MTLSPEEILVKGSGDKLTVESSNLSKPMVIRGVIKKQHADNCVKNNRDYWYIDTGYFGNFPSTGNKKGNKKWHRIVKNENQLSTFGTILLKMIQEFNGQAGRITIKRFY